MSGSLAGADDPTILEWAAQHQRVLITHDIRTVPNYVAERVTAGHPVTGVVAVPKRLGIGAAIEEVFLVWSIATEDDLRNQVIYVPL